jgi:tRNA(Ile)-lysidine synthase
MRASVIDAVTNAVRDGLGSRDRIVLAVSGGLDSMTLLDAAVRTVPDRIAAVATFDHRTGPHSTDAAELVQARAASHGLRTIVGHADIQSRTEEAWRAARWRFLREAGGEAPGVIATAHTRDDQVETVLMRVMRDSGARGLAGLYASSSILRPLLRLPRTVIASYAQSAGLTFIADPSNDSRSHFRNRVRLDLLPALRGARPGIEDELLDIAKRAATLRSALDRVIDESGMARVEDGTVHVATAALAGYDSAALRTLWPALAARAGAVLDHRGTRRLAAFTTMGRPGTRIQLSGGWEVVRRQETFIVRRAASDPARGAPSVLAGELRFGDWYFSVADEGAGGGVEGPGSSAWVAALPADRTLTVRAWQPGDRLVKSGKGGMARRVKRFLAEAGVAGPDRAGWPVVLADDEIVWIPGVRRSDAATVRSGRPVVLYACDRIDC